MEKIPIELREDVALRLDYQSLLRYCLVSTAFKRVCDNFRFWRNKIKLDFPKADTSEISPDEMREYYFIFTARRLVDEYMKIKYDLLRKLNVPTEEEYFRQVDAYINRVKEIRKEIKVLNRYLDVKKTYVYGQLYEINFPDDKSYVDFASNLWRKVNSNDQLHKFLQQFNIDVPFETGDFIIITNRYREKMYFYIYSDDNFVFGVNRSPIQFYDYAKLTGLSQDMVPIKIENPPGFKVIFMPKYGPRGQIIDLVTI